MHDGMFIVTCLGYPIKLHFQDTINSLLQEQSSYMATDPQWWQNYNYQKARKINKTKGLYKIPVTYLDIVSTLLHLCFYVSR